LFLAVGVALVPQFLSVESQLAVYIGGVAQQGLLALRRELGVYANLRPARAGRIDLLIVRELVGGLYFGAKGTRDDGTWFDTCEYSRPEVERIAR